MTQTEGGENVFTPNWVLGPAVMVLHHSAAHWRTSVFASVDGCAYSLQAQETNPTGPNGGLCAFDRQKSRTDARTGSGKVTDDDKVSRQERARDKSQEMKHGPLTDAIIVVFLQDKT